MSQDDHPARKDYATLPNLKINAEDNREDIAAYVNFWCGEIERKFDLPSERTRRLAEQIAVESEGKISALN
jgi:hypothetical protein